MVVEKRSAGFFVANIRRVACAALMTLALMFLALATVAPASAQSADAKPNREDMKRGAVLCVWQIYAFIREFGSTCHPFEDADVRDEIARSVDRMEQFIVINGQPDPNYISTWEQRFRDTGKNKDICKSKAAEQMYKGFIKSTPAEIKDKTDFLLAVPRRPMLNPCL
jgi:hypothetical protein